MVARMQRTTVWLLLFVSLLWLATRAFEGAWVSGVMGAVLSRE